MPTPESHPDEFEASAKRYGNSFVIVVPLRSGRFGVFNAARELHSIVEAGDLVTAVLAVPALKPRKRTSPEPSFSLEDLDL